MDTRMELLSKLRSIIYLVQMTKNCQRKMWVQIIKYFLRVKRKLQVNWPPWRKRLMKNLKNFQILISKSKIMRIETTNCLRKYIKRDKALRNSWKINLKTNQDSITSMTSIWTKENPWMLMLSRKRNKNL